MPEKPVLPGMLTLFTIAFLRILLFAQEIIILMVFVVMPESALVRLDTNINLITLKIVLGNALASLGFDNLDCIGSCPWNHLNIRLELLFFKR